MRNLKLLFLSFLASLTFTFTVHAEDIESFDLSQQGCIMLGKVAASGAMEADGSAPKGATKSALDEFFEGAPAPVKKVFDQALAEGLTGHRDPDKQFDITARHCLEVGGKLNKLMKPEV